MSLSPHLQRLMDEGAARETEEAALKLAREEDEARRRVVREEEEKRMREEREARVGVLLPRFKALESVFVDAVLAEMGLSTHERAATLERVPEAIRRAAPLALDRSFGLVGGFGAGKTCAVAAAIRERVTLAVSKKMEEVSSSRSEPTLTAAIRDKRLSFSFYTRWINWPGDSVRMRNRLFSAPDDVEEWIECLQNPVHPVILDDIGADRKAGNDWIGETLERIIDERERHEAKLIWTSNLDAKGLIDRYGARLFSRLQGLAPAIVLPQMPDLRVRRVNP